MSDTMKISEAPTVQNVFEKELELIQDAGIRMFVLDVFGQMCPSYFWRIPASVRGHHPPICRTSGGLVHHVKLAVNFADGFLDMLDIHDDLRRSQVIAAVLLHDMMKRGKNAVETDTFGDHRMANRCHGRYCADQIVEYPDSQQWGRKLAVLLNPIITAVRLHMGRWTWKLRPEEAYELEHCEITRTTHLADYAASRALHQYLSERAVDPTMRYLND